jgi:uncharacterized protein
MENNFVGWFEIPVVNMERAIKFYEQVLKIRLSRNQMGTLDMAWFPFNENGLGSSGSLVHHPDHYKPSADGVLIYFSSRKGDLADELSRIEAAGGQVLVPKTLIAEDIGYMAVFLDTEGNRIALHSR